MTSTNILNGGGASLEELFDVLDENGNKTGRTKPRSAVHRDGDWHRAVDVIIVNNHGEILLQRRAPDKDSFPGLLDISCGGHLVAGDDSLSGVRRELKEELDLDARPEDLTFLHTDKVSIRPAPDFINNSFNDIYTLRTDKTLDELHPQAEEISELVYVTPDELRALLPKQGIEIVPHDDMYDIAIKLAENQL